MVVDCEQWGLVAFAVEWCLFAGGMASMMDFGEMVCSLTPFTWAFLCGRSCVVGGVGFVCTGTTPKSVSVICSVDVDQIVRR